MPKQQTLEILMLLSALESWSFSVGKMFPDYLHENLSRIVSELSEQLLEESK